MPAVCLLLLAAASSASRLGPLNAAPSSCTTPDPFAVIGGGVCVAGGWLPKAMVPEPEIPSLPPAPPPIVPSAPVQSQICSTPDPFVALGGGVCYDGGWLPPGILPPTGAGPLPSLPPATPAPAPIDNTPCSTPDPFVSLGGGTCYLGGWLPPGTVVPVAPADPDPPLPPPLPTIEVRITGTVRHDAGGWVVVSGSGVRHFIAEGLPQAARSDGLVVTFAGSAAATPDSSDRVVTSLKALAVLPIAQPLPDSAPGLLNDRVVTVRSDADVDARRSALRTFIWGEAGFPVEARPTVLRDDSSPVSGLENLAGVDTLVMDMDEGRSAFGHHFSPRRSNNRAVVLHHGHACTFDDSSGTADAGYGMRRTLNALLVQGYSVVAIYMPNHARFSTTRLEVDDCFSLTHYGMFTAPASGPGSPLKYFLTPTAMAVNYLGADLGFTDVSMVGLSGGGWATTVYSAIDPRITTSIQVAGTMPLYLQRAGLTGDTEQVLDAFYRLAGYPDLYVLGAAGAGRSQLQILNRRDDCCFSEEQSGVAPGTFDVEVRTYERAVRDALADIGSGGFRVEIDEAAPAHMISWNSVLNQVLPELNGGHQHVAATSPDTAFVRGVNGHLWQFDSGTWRDTGLPMVGAPAALAGAVNAHDVFYRSPSGRLMHAYPSGSGWQEKDLGVVVLSDPAAASWGPGRFDVVSIDTAYRPVHVSFEGGKQRTDIAGTSDPSMGIGRPALVTTGAGNLHLFVQGRHDRALHSMQFGPDRTWSTEILPSTMLDFPGAVVDASGSVRGYIRGGSQALWEVARVAGQWRWTSVTSAAGGRQIRGTPSPSLSGGQITVHARTESAGLAAFRLADGWSIEDAGGMIKGSPTSSNGAAHAPAASSGQWLFTTGWTWIGRAMQ